MCLQQPDVSGDGTVITADTITDEQLANLRDEVDSDETMLVFNNKTMSVAYLCERALKVAGLARRAARARCAEILNARAASKAGDR